jgi:16S rRNA (uracil1498-N3)-methyltransferase
VTTTFYTPPGCFHGERAILPDEEARHAVKVLRKQAGDEIIAVDGEGGWYRIRLDQVGQRRAAGTVLETRRGVGEPAYELVLGIGLIKSRNRFETFVEKAVELGGHTIIPLHTARTEKEGLKAERTRNIMVAAMKQCGRSRLPALSDPTALPTVLEAATAHTTLVAHERVDAAASVCGALAEVPPTARLLVLIGPEGGFTKEEIAMVEQAGGIAVSLGPRRLRAETAGIAAAVAVQQALAESDSPHSL